MPAILDVKVKFCECHLSFSGTQVNSNIRWNLSSWTVEGTMTNYWKQELVNKLVHRLKCDLGHGIGSIHWQKGVWGYVLLIGFVTHALKLISLFPSDHISLGKITLSNLVQQTRFNWNSLLKRHSRSYFHVARNDNILQSHTHPNLMR